MRPAADRLGVSVATICYHAAYIRRLPPDLVSWLESGNADQFGAIFLENQLRKLVKIDNSEQTQAIVAMLAECRQNATSRSQIAELQKLEHRLTQVQLHTGIIENGVQEIA